MHRNSLPIGMLLVVMMLSSGALWGGEGVAPESSAGGTWLALGDALQSDAALAAATADAPARSTTQPSSQPAQGDLRTNDEGRQYIYWKHRSGPAYPGDFWTSFGRYGKEMPETLWDDTKAVATNWVSLVGLGAAGVVGITINASGSDNRVQDHFEKHGHQLNSFWDTVGDVGGNPGTHFAVAGAMYFTALARNDAQNYDKATTLINALIITDLLTLGLKGAAQTDSPNGDHVGWPSGHTSSSFAFATVVAEEYGPLAGVPAFAFASYVGYERIDARNHDFSDVLSGALIGMAIGHAVVQNHMPRINGFQIVPMVDPASGTMGVAMSKRW